MWLLPQGHTVSDAWKKVQTQFDVIPKPLYTELVDSWSSFHYWRFPSFGLYRGPRSLSSANIPVIPTFVELHSEEVHCPSPCIWSLKVHPLRTLWLVGHIKGMGIFVRVSIPTSLVLWVLSPPQVPPSLS